MKRIVTFLLAFAMVFTSLSNVSFATELTVAERPADGVTQEQPFVPEVIGSQKFRIPCLVSLDSGTIVAGADARWTTAADGGGLDTVVSRSTDMGDTWNYTFANHFGDNGNAHNSYSTSFIDPAMATDGKTVYLVADLFPAGYAVMDNYGARYGVVGGQNGLTESGNLRLAKATEADADGDGTVSRDERIAATCDYNAYYLEKAPGNVSDNDPKYYVIKDKTGKTLDEYSVDAFFNIKDGDEVDTNLFFSNSPFLTYPTDYLYMTKSVDEGKTWSIPTIMNVKKTDEAVTLVGPGNGIVASNGYIIFTAYSKVAGRAGGELRSCIIYSKDGGKTWERGEDVSYSSSEATVVEIDKKLYMFTRLQQVYYVSEDWGKTWVKDSSGNSKKFPMELGYCHDTQLSAIRYSKKIDGKTAILFSAPSINRRKSGKVYVGLVQDDGSIKWPYAYSVNGKNDFYAYSCIAELKGGSVGLLYEYQGEAITFENIPIEEVAKGATVSDYWFTNDKQEFVGNIDLKPDDSAVLYVKYAESASGNSISNNSLKVTSFNEKYLDATIKDGVLTITAKAVGKELIQEKVTVSNGKTTIEIAVNITTADKYEIVNIAMGETAIFTDNTGDYSDVSMNDITDIADVNIKGNSVGVELKLASSISSDTVQFNVEEHEDIEKALYTFEKVEDGKFKVRGETSRGESVYLNIKGSGVGTPHSTTHTVIQFAERSNNDSTFSIMDTSTSNSGGGYLYFHKDGYRYNRNGAIAEANCYFEIYKSGRDADSEISGFTKVNSVEELEDGGRYLIAKKGDDQNYYFLYPYNGGSNYNHVAKMMPLDTPRANTEITFTGIAEGSAHIDIGNTRYYVTVQNEEAELQLQVGEAVPVKGRLINVDEDEIVVELRESVDLGPYTAVNTIQPGKYLFGNNSYIMKNEASSSQSPKGMAMTTADFTEGTYHQYLWTIEEAEGGYTMQDAKGRYLNFGSGNNVELGYTPQVLTISTKTGGFSVSYQGKYLNNWAGGNNNIASYPSDDNVWSFYKPTGQGYLIYGATEGTTEVVFAGMEYHITVSGIVKVDYSVLKNVLSSVPTDLSGYTDEAVVALNEAVDKGREALANDLDARFQDAVNGYVKEIREAISNLELKVYYNVQFKDGDGSQLYNPQRILKDSTAERPEDPTKDGFRFLGWYMGEEEYDFQTPVTSDITLTAKWEIITVPGVTYYTVSFEDIDGNKLYDADIVSENGVVAEPVVPEKEGHKFLGWYVDGEKYDFTTPVTKDITLTAQWEKITTPEEPGVSDNEPGVSDNEPGVSDNDPSASDNDPGVSDNDPEVSGYENIWVEGLEDKVYTGSKITQQLKLYDGDKLLIEGADYTVSYKNNINACEFTAEELEAFEEAYRKDPKTKANIGSIPSKKAPQVVLKMKGNYTGTRSLFFQIEKQDIADEDNFILDDLTVTNTGKDKTPVPVVTWKYNGKNLKNKKDFTVEQKTEATGTVLVVKGNGNFKGEKEISYVITPDKNTIAMDQVKVTKLTAVDYKEDGSLKPTGFTVKYKKATLKEGTHFEVSEVSANDIMGNGTATVVLTAKEGATEAGYNFVGSKRVSFKVNIYSLSKVKATGLVAQTFTGDDINPLSMTDGNGNPVVNLTIPATKTMAAKTLTADDYTVTYEKNVSKGTASLTLTGIPERGVTGSKKLTFKINPATLSEGEGSGFDVTVASDVSGNDNTVYHTKGGAKPAVTIVRQDGQLLVEGRDYTVAYKANKGPGQGQAIVKGKGNYTGQLSLSYTIEKKPVSEEDGNGVWIQVNDKVYNTKKNSWKQSFKVLDSDGKALANKKDADIKGAVYTVYSLPAEAPEGIKVGDILSDANTVLPEGAEVQITVTMAGSYEGKVTGIYRIINKDKDISKAKFQLRPQQYTGEAVIIDGNDDFAKRDLKGTTLSMEEGQTFEVVEGSYINNIKKGTAKVTLRGVGEYGGIKTVTFKIGARSVADWFDTEFQYWN